MTGHDLHQHSQSSTPGPIPSPGLNATSNATTEDDTVSSKRQKPNVSSRGVANLTPEQLAKKRANDREAQRAIRKRTRTQIEALERKVQELTSQQPYQDLQEALKQIRILTAENHEIRTKLSSVLAIIQPILNSPAQQQQQGDGASFAQQGYHNTSTIRSGSQSQQPENTAQEISPGTRPDNTSRQHYTNSSPSGKPIQALTGQEPTNTNSPRGSFDSVSPVSSVYVHDYRQDWNTASIASQRSERSWSPGSQSLEYNIRASGQDLELTNNGERLGLNFLVDSSHVPRPNEFRPTPNPLSGHTNIRYSQTSQGGQQPFGDTGNISPFTVPVRNINPTCPIDAVLLDFLRSRQREAAEGATSKQLVGPPYPSVASLLNPAKSADSHPLSRVFTDVISKFPNISALPEQVAIVYIMFLMMRWQIYPTQENYERIPEWFTPRASQLITPHPAWMDYVPWPRMRDRMIAAYADYDFASWFPPYTSGLSVNWPYEPTDALLATGDSDELTINPVFERHLRDLNNWSLSSAYEKAYPELGETARIKD